MEKRELLEFSERFIKAPAESLDREQIGLLQSVIRAHNELYYVNSDPVIDDAQYDLLFRKLSRAEERLGIFDPNSPTKRIDTLLSRQFAKARHLSPMISLDNTYNVEDVLEFGKRATNYLQRNVGIPNPGVSKPDLACILELKFDGLGINILYRDGSFVRALTRGNGVEGEDISINALEIRGVPRTIPFEEEIEIRGEVVMPHAEFERVNRERLEQGEKLFANPRNAASGSLRQLDPLITRSRGLQFFAYSVPYFEERFEELGMEKYSQGIDRLEQWGFFVSPFFEKFTSVDHLAQRVGELSSHKPRFAFDIDGLVIKLESFRLWNELGTTEHHPRSAIAYKFPQELVRTRVNFVEHSVGRTGIVTPVAHLEAVNVGGVIVRRATLHNYEELERKDVRIGDQVFIQRAGEVIPEVVSVITDVRSGTESLVGIPELCPSCGTPLAKDQWKVAVFCPNRASCPAQTSGALKAFISKHAADIDGMGEKIIDLFVEKGFLTDFVSIYHLHEHRDEILQMEGFELKKTQNILEGIERSRHMELARFLVALGIPEVGRKTAKTLAEYLGERMVRNGTDELSESIYSLSVEELLEIRDIGPVSAESVVDFFADNREMISRLFWEVSPTVTKKATGGILSGKSFCVTGSFEQMSRDQIHDIVERSGGEVRSSVSPKLGYLIVGSDAGSKLDKAKEFGVPVLSLEEFLKMAG